MYRVGLPDILRVGSPDGEQVYEKYAVAPVVKVQGTDFSEGGENQIQDLHTFGYLKTVDEWVVIDNDNVLLDERDKTHKTHA